MLFVERNTWTSVQWRQGHLQFIFILTNYAEKGSIYLSASATPCFFSLSISWRCKDELLESFGFQGLLLTNQVTGTETRLHPARVRKNIRNMWGSESLAIITWSTIKIIWSFFILIWKSWLCPHSALFSDGYFSMRKGVCNSQKNRLQKKKLSAFFTVILSEPEVVDTKIPPR